MRAWRVSRRRLTICAALVVAGVSLGGTLATIAVFVSLFLIAEALIPMPVGGLGDADQQFNRILHQRRRDRVLRRSPPLAVVELLGPRAVARRGDLGVEAIAIESVVGTVESAKARAFDDLFRPNRACGSRWKPLWLACRRGDPMSPISVYRVDGEHWLRDGHHRVSVCRVQGTQTIDAEVSEITR